MGIPEEKQDTKETDTLQQGHSLWCVCGDKYPRAEAATSIQIYMLLHPKCKSRLHSLLKRQAIACLYLREGEEGLTEKGGKWSCAN